MHLYPSLRAASKAADIGALIRSLEPLCTGFHIDIMDGRCVTTIADAELVAITQKHTQARLWVHLMVNDPDALIEQLPLKPGDIVSIQIECLGRQYVEEYLKKIRGRGLRTSIALAPATPAEEVIPLMPYLDQLVIMSVEPGASGQTFLPHVMEKITHSITLGSEHNARMRIAADGGINQDNVKLLAAFGVSDLAVGNAIFGTPDPQEALAQLQNSIKRQTAS